MSARLVKWNRTNSGSTFSQCGRFAIRPVTRGREYVGFALKRKRTSSEPGQSQRSWYEDCGVYPAIPAAKKKAEAIMKTELAGRSDRHDNEEGAKREKAAKLLKLLDAARVAAVQLDSSATHHRATGDFTEAENATLSAAELREALRGLGAPTL